MALGNKHCVPCEKSTVPLFRGKAEELLKEVQGWDLSEDGRAIRKEVRFKNFIEAMSFANDIARVAELEGHHPDLAVSWGRVGVSLTTHNISGLSENDFILAAKIDALRT